MNPESERPTVFQPKGDLAWQAVRCEMREMRKRPFLWWLFILGVTSGLCIAVNLANQFYFHRPVSPDRWLLSAFAGPFCILYYYFFLYCVLYRFAQPLSLSSEGLKVGRRLYRRRFSPLVDCRVTECSGPAPLFLLSVYCKPPLSSRPRLAYSAATDDPISAREFAAAFHRRYPQSHE